MDGQYYRRYNEICQQLKGNNFYFFIKILVPDSTKLFIFILLHGVFSFPKKLLPISVHDLKKIIFEFTTIAECLKRLEVTYKLREIH